MESKGRYKQFSTQEPIPVFSQPWWLDAVCGESSWDVFLYEKDGEIIASLPFYVKKRNGLSYITQPPLTQNMGPYIKYPENQSPSKKLVFEKEIISCFVNQIECLPISFYQQNFNFKYTNWLPFYWRDYKQTTYYTYRIHDISNHDLVFSNFDYSKKKNIKKAQKNIQIYYDLTAEEFYENHRLTLGKQGADILYSFDLFMKIHAAAYKNKTGRVIAAKDCEGNIHGALFVVWDQESAYDLISTFDPDYRSSGASSLLVYEMIKEVSQFVPTFDFEGSMIEPVENSFRQFGALQTPYFHIYKTLSKNPLIKLFFKLAKR